MPSLNNKAREEILNIINEEIGMVNEKANSVARGRWKQAEIEVGKELGYGDAVTQIEHTKNQIEGLQSELARLEGLITERGRNATVEDYASIGIEVTADRHGYVYRKPRVFDHAIETVWDVLVLKYLNTDLPFFDIYLSMSQLRHTVKRELWLTGNFEEARMLYQRFHEKVTKVVGKEMPGLLKEVQEIPALRSSDYDDDPSTR